MSRKRPPSDPEPEDTPQESNPPHNQAMPNLDNMDERTLLKNMVMGMVQLNQNIVQLTTNNNQMYQAIVKEFRETIKAFVQPRQQTVQQQAPQQQQQQQQIDPNTGRPVVHPLTGLIEQYLAKEMGVGGAGNAQMQFFATIGQRVFAEQTYAGVLDRRVIYRQMMKNGLLKQEEVSKFEQAQDVMYGPLMNPQGFGVPGNNPNIIPAEGQKVSNG